MKEKYELYEHIYQDSEMACYTINELMKDLKETGKAGLAQVAEQ